MKSLVPLVHHGQPLILLVCVCHRLTLNLQSAAARTTLQVETKQNVLTLNEPEKKIREWNGLKTCLWLSIQACVDFC